jgi:hypothetical protein
MSCVLFSTGFSIAMVMDKPLSVVAGSMYIMVMLMVERSLELTNCGNTFSQAGSGVGVMVTLNVAEF